MSTQEHNQIISTVKEIIQEFENSGIIYEGNADLVMSSETTYPWFTITEYGKEVFLSDDWLPYDPEGYIKTLKIAIPSLDDITLIYIGEAVAAYNRRHLLSATITLGVASENLMLNLVETYSSWIKDPPRKTSFQKNTEGKVVSVQYREFRKEFKTDQKQFSKDIQRNWETYLDGIANFIRFNRNDAGHPTGAEFKTKVVYANLQIFSDYAKFILQLIDLLNP